MTLSKERWRQNGGLCWARQIVNNRNVFPGEMRGVTMFTFEILYKGSSRDQNMTLYMVLLSISGSHDVSLRRYL